MNTNHTPKSSPTGVLRRSLNQLAKDVITLCELQAELLQVDLRDWLRTCLAPSLALAAAAAIVALASMPLVLLSLAYCLVEFAGLSVAASMLIAAGVGLLIAAICGWLAWRIVQRQRGTFNRFNVELARNVRWLKQVLSRPPAPEPEPR